MSKSVLDTIREFESDFDNLQDLKTSDLELELCDRFVEMREASGLTQQQLADRVGFSQAYIAKLENGAYDRCGIATLRKFALALGHDVDLENLFRPVAAYTRARVPLTPNFEIKLSGKFNLSGPPDSVRQVSCSSSSSLERQPRHLRRVA